MAYGTIKVDNITFTNGGIDQNVTVSGIVQSISGNITATGTIQGSTIIGTTTVSGATITGNAGQFTTLTGSTAGFTTVTGTTVTGTTANFATLSGTTITGGHVATASGTYTGNVIAAAFVPTGSTVPTNGVYLPAANSVALATNGTGRLFIDSNGKISVAVAPTGTNTIFEVGGGTATELKVSSTAANNGNFRGIRFGITGDSIDYSGVRFNMNSGELRTEAGFATWGGFQTFYTNGLERLCITSDGKVGVGTSSPDVLLHLRTGVTGLPSTTGTTQTNGVLRIGSTATTGVLDIGSNSDAPWIQSTDRTDLSQKYKLLLNPNGGKVGIGTTAPYNSATCDSYNNTSGEFAHAFRQDNTGGYGIGIGIDSTYLAYFYANKDLSGAPVGSISQNGSATAYNTTSDYRLKENIVSLTGAIDRINQLQVHRFNFIADPDKTVDGFLAHEAQEVVPECATGTKDEVDADGNPVYQGIDQSKLVPLLTAALQEAIGRIETLEAEVAALKGA